jgi:hypothetical protein
MGELAFARLTLLCGSRPIDVMYDISAVMQSPKQQVLRRVMMAVFR